MKLLLCFIVLIPIESNSQVWTKNIELLWNIGDKSSEYKKDKRENDQQSLTLKFSYGATIKDRLFLGLGIGIENYSKQSNHYGSEKKLYLPITLESNYHFLKGDVRPVLNFSGGYAFKLGNMDGGFTVNPSVGVLFQWGKNTQSINFGYRWFNSQAYIFSPTGPDAVYFDTKPTIHKLHNYFTVSTGFTF